ncbi:MAG: outer membrane beta-barrel protein [Bacteroidota bacterium]
MKFLYLVLLLFSSLAATAQSTKTVTASLGYAYHTVKEQRYTSKYRDGTGFSIDLGYESANERVIHRINVAYKSSTSGADLPSSTNNQWAEIQYDYLRTTKQVKGLYLGGYIGTGIIYTERDGPWNDNNIISYTQWLSLGVSSRWNRRLWNKPWMTQLRLPLLSYRTRPSYGSGFPDAFLQPGTFSWREEGLIGAGLRSGRIGSLNEFTKIEFSSDLFFSIGKKGWHFGTGYQFIGIFTGDEKPLSLFHHTIRLIVRRL